MPGTDRVPGVKEGESTFNDFLLQKLKLAGYELSNACRESCRVLGPRETRELSRLVLDSNTNCTPAWESDIEVCVLAKFELIVERYFIHELLRREAASAIHLELPTLITCFKEGQASSTVAKVPCVR